ncbi:fumarate reductase cytochrome b subunit [Shewanella donghaensis]|uniref:fumarate reductase cytochrome b subunit n=1 Tax=Shewanella donghaensis TaxID=238836 RepID=UPI001181CEB0|nr:fumarate reductase cytochrome b subunit [Shewanella donghaensis]
MTASLKTAKTKIHDVSSKGYLNPIWAARADKLQSATGLLLGIFIIMHLHFESSILISKEAFYHVGHFLEGGIFSETGHGFPVVTKFISAFMLIVVLVHALFALRRFPAQIQQWRALRSQMTIMPHQDTKIWFWQLITGFLLFFLAPVHLFDMITNPEIGAHLSAERVYHQDVWMLYVLLLPAVVLHAMFGLYRLAVKWGVTTKRTAALKLAKIMVVYLMIIGIASLLTYIFIGQSLELPVTPFVPS